MSLYDNEFWNEQNTILLFNLKNSFYYREAILAINHNK